MATTAELKGNWDKLKGQIRERWSTVSESDFTRVQGNPDQLIGMIEQKTGTARREIEQFLDGAQKSCESTVQNAAETVREYANKATEVVKDQYGRVNKQLETGLEDAQAVIRTSPGTSVGVALGAGFVVGCLFSLLLRPEQKSWYQI